MLFQLMHVDNPLRMLRAGHLPLVKARNRTATMPTASHSRTIERRSIPDCSDIGKTGEKQSSFENVFVLS